MGQQRLTFGKVEHLHAIGQQSIVVYLILPFASNRKTQTFFHIYLRFKRTRWVGQTCMLTRNNQLV
jgi:hypothetical protein